MNEVILIEMAGAGSIAESTDATASELLRMSVVKSGSAQTVNTNAWKPFPWL